MTRSEKLALFALSVIQIAALFIAGIMAAHAQDNRAVSDIGLCHPRYNYEGFISQFRNTTAIRTHFLMRTFNKQGCPNVVRLVHDARKIELHVSILNGPGERNRRLQPHEYLHGLTQAAADQQFARGAGEAVNRYRRALAEARALIPVRDGLALAIKPCLECNYGMPARRFLVAEARKVFPEALMIDNPMGGCLKDPGILCEKHSNVSGYDIVDLDGTDYDKIKPFEWATRNKSAKRVAAWKYCKNGFKKDEAWKPPAQRTNFCGERDNRDLQYWLRPDATLVSSRPLAADLKGCTRYKVRDGDSKGFVWKLGDGRNYAVMLAPVQLPQFGKLELVRNGEVLDRGRFRALYAHDPRGKQRRVYDFTKPTYTFPDGVVIRATAGKTVTCFPLNKPQFRID